MKRLSLLLLSALMMVAAFSCITEKTPTEPETQGTQETPEPPETQEPPETPTDPDESVASCGAYKHVVIIGVDGGGAFFKDTPTPRLDEIFA